MSIRRDDIARLSGGDEYAQYLLRARREFERGHAATSRQIQDVYRRAAAGIRDDIAALTPGTLRYAHLTALQAKLDGRAAQMSKDVLAATHQGIWMASAAGSQGVTQVTQHMLGDAFPAPAVARLFAGINERATLAMLARTRRDGLKISDRVWRTSEAARNNIRRIVEDAVARGQDSRKTARQVQQYLQPGVWKAHKDETRRRLGVSKDISYQAMRLARTEMNNAFHEGMIAANQHSPGYRGIYWRLSAQHVIFDICTDMSADMSHGEPGFYPKGFEPVRPHPSCRCVPIPAYQSPEQFAERLRSWQRNPRLQPDIERWYNEDARRFMGRTVIITAPTALETALRKAEPQIAGLQHERVYLFDKNGKEVLVKDGSRNQVSFTASERAMMKGNTLTHNHPTTGGSFSWDDIWLAAQEDMAEVRAVGQKYVHRMIKPEAGWPEVSVIRDAYQVADDEVYRMFIPKVNAGIMTITEAGEKHYHEVWLRAARKTGLNYIREAR